MTNEGMKELYETGEYVLYYCVGYGSEYAHWNLSERPYWEAIFMNKENDENTLRLIHKRHSEIAEAVVNNPNVEVESTNVYGYNGNPMLFTTTVSFFEWYSEKYEYRLKPQVGKEDEQRQSRNNNNSNMDLKRDRETISITAPDGTVHEFEKPEFECELLEVKDEKIFGWHRGDNGYIEIIRFNFSGGSNVMSTDLTPVKKEWYDYSENFPAVMVEGATGKWFIVEFKEQYHEYCDDSDRLATKEEVMSLYWKDK